MSLYTQLALIALLSGLLGVASFFLLKSRYGQWVDLIVALLWGAFCALLVAHGHEVVVESETLMGKLQYLLCVVAGAMAFFLISQLAHQHSHKHFLRISSVIPHSFLDGALWALSLGFNPQISDAVFLFILLHRTLEVSSWMGLFRDLPVKKAMGILAAMVLAFSVSALVVVKGYSLHFSHKEVLLWIYMTSLGYLALPMLKELLERFKRFSPARRGWWILSSLIGFALTLYFER